MTVVAAILAGGMGTRLWPVSRQSFPKQFMRLPDGQTLLSKTFARAGAVDGVDNILLLTNREYYFQSADEYRRSGAKAELHSILEPVSRNTAPALALAAQFAVQRFGADTIMIVLAADHLILPQSSFDTCVADAVSMAKDGWIVTFGVKPEYPETGYGYIELDREHPVGAGFKVKHFKEKPALEVAQSYLDDGKHFWNSGMFCFCARTFLAEIGKAHPQLAESADRSWAASDARNKEAGGRDGIFELDPETLSQMADISVDYAVVERSDRVAVVMGDFTWNDIGSWKTVSELTRPDDEGNRLIGEVLLVDSRNNFVQTENRLVAAVGIENLLVIDTPDALLIADRDRAQDVKKVGDLLRSKGHEAHKIHRTVHRPWGSYTVLEEGKGYKIKRIEVRPGNALSLQMHYHRSEHWIVLSGTACVTRGDEEIVLGPNQSTYIPANSRHRLKSLGRVPLVVIEVQTGEYLGEDDIVRLEDQYNRV